MQKLEEYRDFDIEYARNDWTLLQTAADDGRVAVVEYLLSQGASKFWSFFLMSFLIISILQQSKIPSTHTSV